MKVVEIFNSIDGEGKRTGQPAAFIRLAGCNLRCSYCDTLYALFGEKEECVYEEMSIDEITEKVNYPHKRITLTGGEPLVHDGSAELVSRLIKLGFEVNIETNGACDICEFLERLDKDADRDKLFFTIDYKLPSSGMCERMIWKNFLSLNKNDVLKFVVGSDEDVIMMRSVVKRMNECAQNMPNIFIGTVYGKYDGSRIIEMMLFDELFKDARYQVQLHKIIWEPDRRGV